MQTQLPAVVVTFLIPWTCCCVFAADATTARSDEALGRVIRERALWEDNRLGITDKVPPPWTPLQVQGGLVSCWGRTYDFDGSLFPRQAWSQGAEILAGPIALAIRGGGEEALLQAAATQQVTAAEHEVNIESAADALGLSAQVLCHLEYDGCLRVELVLSAQAPVVVESLELRIPIKPERALYYHWFEATRDPKLTNAGALPPEGLRSHFKPLLWLGDDERGFCWFCESPKGWGVADRESVLRVTREAEACVMRIRMADRPLVIAGRWQVTFGLMATPVRPMPTDAQGRQIWRDLLIGLNLSNPWSAWAPGFNNLSGTDDPGTLTPKDVAAMRRWVQQSHDRGWVMPLLPMREPMKVVPYSQVVFWSGKLRDGTVCPEIRVFGPEWSYSPQQPGPRREADDAIPAKEYYWVCPASSFAQFYIYKLNQLIDQTDIDGIYIDGPWNTCSNRLHGCGYMDENGRWQREFKIWPYRELLKRIYCLFYEKRKDPIIYHHTSCWLCIPSISFCHMMVDGEQYHDPGQKVEDHFMDVVPLDKWRAEHTGRQWGPAPFILSDIPAKWCVEDAPTRELLMLTNLHDTAIFAFPVGNKTKLVMRNYQAKRLFGIAECEFRGYWGNADWVRCDTPECHVSVYRKTDASRCLLVIGNTSKADLTAVVHPDFAALKLEGGVAEAGVDIENGERIPLDSGALAVPVKARDFRLVALPYYEAPSITAGDYRASALRQVPNPGFEDELEGWTVIPVEGNAGTVSLDTETKFTGAASCHLHKAEGPGGMMIQTDDVFLVEPGKKYRANCQLKIANSSGAKAYWMISQLNEDGGIVGTKNLFHGFLTQDQDWAPLPFEFEPLPGTAVIRLHFLVALPGAMDAWVDDFSLEELP